MTIILCNEMEPSMKETIPVAKQYHYIRYCNYSTEDKRETARVNATIQFRFYEVRPLILQFLGDHCHNSLSLPSLSYFNYTNL